MASIWWRTAVMLLLSGGSALAQGAPPTDLSEAAINAATFEDYTARQKAAEEATPSETTADASKPSDSDATTGKDEAPDPFLIRVQVLLDRAHASPGVIDGHDGGNTDKAIRAFEEMRDMKGGGSLDEALWQALSQDARPS